MPQMYNPEQKKLLFLIESHSELILYTIVFMLHIKKSLNYPDIDVIQLIIKASSIKSI